MGYWVVLSWTAFLSSPCLLVSEACEGHIQIRTGSESRKMLELHKTSRRPDCVSAGWTLRIIVHFSSHFYSFQVWIASMVVVFFSTLLPHNCVFWYTMGWKQAHGLAWNIALWSISGGKEPAPCNKEQTWNVLELANWVLLLCWNQFIGL